MTADDIDATLAAFLDTAGKATPGPWERHTDKAHLDPFAVFGHGGTLPDRLTHVASVAYGWHKDDDAAFIAASRTLAPAMAVALRAVLALCERQDARWKDVVEDGLPIPLTTDEVRRAITETLGADR